MLTEKLEGRFVCELTLDFEIDAWVPTQYIETENLYRR